MRKLLTGLALGAALSASAQVATVILDNCVLTQNPQNRTVEVTYELTGDTPVYVTLDITTNGVPIPAPEAVWGDVSTKQFLKTIEPDDLAPKKIYWLAKQDWPGNLTTEARATVTAWFTNDPPVSLSSYLVVDLTGGPSAIMYPVRFAAMLPESHGATPAHKTTELWLRRIPAGTFMMGSPAGELGFHMDPAKALETQHQVTLTQDFHIGVFEVTQRQYELVMGTNTAVNKGGPARPVESVSYATIRGAVSVASWPASNHVDPDSFMGRLRARTSLIFDLPTEAQWEYACRAGTTSALNSGKELTHPVSCAQMTELASYRGNTNEHTVVGSRLPNAWGVYDMHGNVWEWCLDSFEKDLGGASVVDPKGNPVAGNRMYRGGCYNNDAGACRSAGERLGYLPTSSHATLGFRAAIQPPPGGGQ